MFLKKIRTNIMHGSKNIATNLNKKGEYSIKKLNSNFNKRLENNKREYNKLKNYELSQKLKVSKQRIKDKFKQEYTKEKEFHDSIFGTPKDLLDKKF